jgi:hypothetical protein
VGGTAKMALVTTMAITIIPAINSRVMAAITGTIITGGMDAITGAVITGGMTAITGTAITTGPGTTDHIYPMPRTIPTMDTDWLFPSSIPISDSDSVPAATASDQLMSARRHPLV